MDNLSPIPVSESAKYWHSAVYPELEMLNAVYITHAFARHVHEGYALGVILEGAEMFYYRGQTHIAPAGSIVLINPDEIHTGQTASGAHWWHYRMFYPSIALLRQIAEEITGQPWEMPYFGHPIVYDAETAQLLHQFHQALEQQRSALELGAHMRAAFGQLIIRHAINRPLLIKNYTGKTEVRRVRDYLRDHYAENPTLEQLAALVNLSPYHLLRLFRQQIGLPPHQYLSHIRLHRAKQLLTSGRPIAEVAVETGFTDQSHLTKHFKRVFGVTPGHYTYHLRS